MAETLDIKGNEAGNLTGATRSEGDAEARGPGRPGGEESRARILDAAGRLFADRSFDGVSVREIAREAGVNGAAINYHFGSKEALYHGVLLQLIADTEPLFRPIVERLIAGLATADGDPEKLSRVAAAMIRDLMRGILGHASLRWQMPIMLREFHHPSSEFAMLVQDRINPVHDVVALLISAATGYEKRAPETLLLTANMIAQCMAFGATKGLILARLNWEDYTPERINLIIRTMVPRMLAMIDLPESDPFVGEEGV